MTTPAPASPVQIFRHEDYDGIYPVDAIRNDDAGYYVQFDAYAKVEAERDRLRAALRECAPLVKTAAVRDRAYAALREAKP